MVTGSEVHRRLYFVCNFLFGLEVRKPAHVGMTRRARTSERDDLRTRPAISEMSCPCRVKVQGYNT